MKRSVAVIVFRVHIGADSNEGLGADQFSGAGGVVERSGVPMVAEVDIRAGGVMLQDRLNIPFVGGLMDGDGGCLDLFFGRLDGSWG